MSQERLQDREPGVVPQLDYTALTTALVTAMQQAGVLQNVDDVEQDQASLPSAKLEPSMISQEGLQTVEEVSLDVKIAQAYKEIRMERASQQNNKAISARDLAKRANIRRSTCSEWLQKHEEKQGGATDDASNDEPVSNAAQSQE